MGSSARRVGENPRSVSDRGGTRGSRPLFPSPVGQLRRVPYTRSNRG